MLRNFLARSPFSRMVGPVVRSARIVAVVAVLGVCAAPAHAAFPGRNGLLAVGLPTGNVALVSPSGQVERQLCGVAALCGAPVQPRWSPDGQRLALVDGSSSRIEILDADGTCLWCLLGAPLTALHGSRPAFSANGERISFPAGNPAGAWNVALTGGPATLAIGGRVSDAVWSSKGELAFVRAGTVWVRGATGRRLLRRLTTGAAPSWSPDGSELAVARAGWVWAIQVRNGRARRLTRGGAPAWSPDGRSIAYIGATGDVRLIGVRGGRSQTLGLTGRSVDWQPLPRNPPGACRTPSGAQVVGTTAQGVVVSNPNTNSGFGGWYGCLRGIGRWRLLASGSANDAGYYTTLSAVRLAGRFALVDTAYSDKYENCSLQAGLTDLATGASTPLVSQGCDYPSADQLDSFVLDSSGFAAWRSTHSIPLYEPLSAVSCPSVSRCVATDSTGSVASSTNPDGGRSAWSLVNVAQTASLSSISCPTADLCVAVGDSGGEVFTSTDPSGGPSAWTGARADTQVVPIFPDGYISCPSASLCVLADGSGNIATSTNPAGGASTWSIAHVGSGTPPGLIGVTCASNSLCVALDNHGDVITSTNPTGGRPAWTTTPVEQSSSGFLQTGGVSCPSTSLCVAVTGTHILTSTNPTGGTGAWADTMLGSTASLDAISCPSTSLCVAVDNAGDVITSTDPTGGATAWHSADVDETNPLSGVSCPSVSQCVLVDGKGNVLSSSVPTGGSAAWRSTPVDVPDCAVEGTPCAVETLFAHDDHGTRLVDSTPPGSGKVLSDVALSGNGLVLSWTHNGLPEQLPLG